MHYFGFWTPSIYDLLKSPVAASDDIFFIPLLLLLELFSRLADEEIRSRPLTRWLLGP